MLEKFVIMGGKPLMGEVEVSGAKNAAVAIIPAALIVDGISTIENIPDIVDVRIIVDILKQLGAKISLPDKHTLIIDSRNITSFCPPYDMVQQMRASYYLLGALLARFNHAIVPPPGGCNFGVRPIDQHLRGFNLLGASTVIKNGAVNAHADELIGTSIYMDNVSVGATINVMLAAVRAKGVTTIENAAKEPHIVDLANYLNSMGAIVKGAGTDVIKITGVEKLSGGTYSIIPDQIEAGTFMVAAAATNGNVLIKNVIPKHLESITAKLTEIGATVEEYDDSVRVYRKGELNKTNLKTLPYPGFPTDMQPQMSIILSISKGTSVLTEGVWDNRFQYMDELRRLGATVKVDGRIAVIEGVDCLTGAPVKATDLRAGAALVIAGLIAKGVTEIHNLKYIDRGYEHFEEKLRSLGAQIIRKNEVEIANNYADELGEAL